MQLLGVEHEIMKLPEFPLSSRTVRGLGSFFSQAVHGQRKVFENHGHVTAKLLAHFREIIVHFLAIRALIVRKFHDLDLGILWAKAWSVSHFNMSARLTQFDHDAILSAQFSDIGI